MKRHGNWLVCEDYEGRIHRINLGAISEPCDITGYPGCIALMEMGREDESRWVIKGTLAEWDREVLCIVACTSEREHGDDCGNDHTCVTDEPPRAGWEYDEDGDLEHIASGYCIMERDDRIWIGEDAKPHPTCDAAMDAVEARYAKDNI